MPATSSASAPCSSARSRAAARTAEEGTPILRSEAQAASPMRIAYPSSRNRLMIKAAVRNSVQPASGWAWKSRRHAASFGSTAASAPCKKGKEETDIDVTSPGLLGPLTVITKNGNRISKCYDKGNSLSIFPEPLSHIPETVPIPEGNGTRHKNVHFQYT